MVGVELDRIPDIAKHLSLVFFLAWLGRSTAWNFLPIFIERHIASVFLVGIVTSLPAAIPVILDIPVGNLVQRAGEKIVILSGLLVAALPPLMYVTALPAMLVVGKMLEGVAKALVFNGGWSITMQSSNDDVEAESLSVFLLGLNLAIVIGPIIGGYLIDSYGFPVTFGLWVFTASLAVLVFLSYIGLERKRGFIESIEELLHRDTYGNDWRHLKQNWGSIRFPLALIFLYSIIFSFYWLAIPLLLDKMGAGFITMGLIFGAAALPKVFQFMFGDLADRIGDLRVVALTSLLLTPVLVSMNFLSGAFMIGAMFFVARIFSAGMSPALHSIFDARCPEEHESELTGFLEFFKHSGQALGPVVAGTAASIWSLNASFLVAAAVSAVIFASAIYSFR
ncbi:MAG: MFS transporter [Candidatus Nanohaloarchaea archaeon]